jgi:hypothetical protein
MSRAAPLHSRGVVQVILTSLLAAAAATAEPVRNCRAVSPAHQAALVELYTSQGCSSCPPADRWLSQLEARHTRDRVVPIALHVDYWDRLGWKDPYAREAFTARQRALAAANGSRTVYTPGVFVQSQEFPPWSNAARFDEAVRKINSTPAVVRISLAATVDGTSLRLDAQAQALASAHDPRLTLALVESGLATGVGAGENRGETLRNDRVARAWLGPLPLTPSPQLWTLPTGDHTRFAIVGFVEDASGRVLQAVDLPLAGC